jgi:hypothetical protein
MMSALPPKADKQQIVSVCPLSAKSGQMHRSKMRRYSITSSARASSVGGTRPSVFLVAPSWRAKRL